MQPQQPPLTTGPASVVIGTGIVGLAAAYHLHRDGASVVLVDRDPEGDKASLGNAGGIAVTEITPASVPGIAWKVPGWLLDPLGPLAIRPGHALRLLPWLWRFARAGRPAEVARITAAIAALNARVYQDLVPLLTETGLLGELRRSGALTVYRSRPAYEADRPEWEVKRRYGFETEFLGRAELHDVEPALGPALECGLFNAQTSHVTDPRRIVDGLRQWLAAQGVPVLAGTVVDVERTTGGASVRLADGRALPAATVVVAAGAWSAALAARLGDRACLESERGYNTTIPEPGITLRHKITFAERKFVVTPLSCGLRIGGTAEFGGLEAAANYRRSQALVRLASSYLPGLRPAGGTEWAGHRPATPDSLPVIGRSARHANVLYAFGHGHLGLTQAATTGRIIADLASCRPPPVDLAPYSIARFG